MSKSRKPVNRGFRFDIEKGDDHNWSWTLCDRFGKVICWSASVFPRQQEAGKDCWKLQDGLSGYVQTFVNGKELTR